MILVPPSAYLSPIHVRNMVNTYLDRVCLPGIASFEVSYHRHRPPLPRPLEPAFLLRPLLLLVLWDGRSRSKGPVLSAVSKRGDRRWGRQAGQRMRVNWAVWYSAGLAWCVHWAAPSRGPLGREAQRHRYRRHHPYSLLRLSAGRRKRSSRRSGGEMIPSLSLAMSACEREVMHTVAPLL